MRAIEVVDVTTFLIRCSAFFSVLITGCAILRHDLPVGLERPPAEAVVFVADGAGNFQAASRSLREVVRQEGLPIDVETFVWSHGYFRILADQLCYPHMREEGFRLAQRLCQFRQQFPYCKIFVVGHSAGVGPVLAALENLPPGIVENVILLNPSVSATYDLRGVLQNSRQGIDVFYSAEDWVYLGLAIQLLGTADRRWETAGGRFGFQPLLLFPGDADLYAKLRQHAWTPEDAALGNNGGHYGSYQPEYLKKYILPILLNHRPSSAWQPIQ